MSYIIGIDLGTTQSTLSYTSTENREITLFPIHQQITDSLEAKKESLPSFILLPPNGETPSVGWHARARGTELPDRVIASAKSWLSHDLIDRRSSFLPLSDHVDKQSPLAASSAFLSHLRTCWETEFPNHPLKDQTVLITVPASFDPSARSLVEEAAKLAGYPEVRLIEEPLAAFYAWLNRHQPTWRDHLKVGDVVLVVDVGGGTTDFSLISVSEVAGDLTLERKSVGNHLLLGGDNIDLTLAHCVQNKLGTPIDDWQFHSLVHACRDAKERLLGEQAPHEINVSIQGRGSRLIGGSLSVTLTKEEIENWIVEGFFPLVPKDEPVLQEKRVGIAKIGLPFARDPRVTVQLAHFLAQSGSLLPTAVLFNGGTMKAHPFQQRVLHQLAQWSGQEVRNLLGADLEAGVSRGAAYYGWSRVNGGLRVKAATCHSYFIGVESSAPAIPGVTLPIKKVRVVPFGMEEGSEVTLEGQTFSLLLNEPAIFRFFSQNNPNQDAIQELHPIETVLEAQGEEQSVVWVKLKAKITELGALELWCIADDERTWKLEFDIRTT